MIRTHACGLLAILLGSVSVSAESFPYSATIKTQEATVRSGPGNNYYATDLLEKDEVVEVYRQVKNNWFAIRPPAGSFSWVLAQDVKASGEKNLLQVNRSGSKTRVGSNLTQLSNVEYVSLRKNEIIQSLGSAERLPGKSLLAYRIEPPSGEFRWIHRRYLDRLAGGENTPDKATGSGVVRATFDKSDIDDRNEGVHLEKLSQGSMETVPIPGPSPEKKPAVTSTPTSSSPTRPITPQPQRQLQILNAYLSQTVAMPVGSWDLEPIRRKIREISSNSADNRLRRSAQQLLNRVAEFDRLQRRHRALADRPLPSQAVPRTRGQEQTVKETSKVSFQEPMDKPSNKLLEKSAALKDIIPWSIRSTRPKPVDSQPTIYQGEGWLIPVFTNRQDLPSFALTDDDGAILYFVTPRSGLNLRRYLRKRVGIVGAIETNSPQEQARLTAQRIIVLDRHRR
ncbi:MAG: SH3 domain-containing protein [Pirellulaceae bacterium]|nr:SH3 domain-containing protein [Pirellulaceae bacterium]